MPSTSELRASSRTYYSSVAHRHNFALICECRYLGCESASAAPVFTIGNAFDMKASAPGDSPEVTEELMTLMFAGWTQFVLLHVNMAAMRWSGCRVLCCDSTAVSNPVADWVPSTSDAACSFPPPQKNTPASPTCVMLQQQWAPGAQLCCVVILLESKNIRSGCHAADAPCFYFVDICNGVACSDFVLWCCVA